jgi:hypothetical protein
VLYPPSCALTDGRFRFRIGLCVEVLRPKRWQPPAIQQKPAPGEHLDVVSAGPSF